MSCKFKQSNNMCSLCSPATSPYCVETGEEAEQCSIYRNEKEIDKLKIELTKTKRELEKERIIKAEVFNTLFSIHTVYILNRDNKYYLTLVINGEIYSWEVDEQSIMEGAYSAIPIRKRNIWTSHI